MGSNLNVINIVSRILNRVKVIHVDARSDIVLLIADGDISPHCDLTTAELGEDCYQAGLSAFGGSGTDLHHVFVDRGVIGSKHLDQQGHIQATPGASVGDSGGGCFRTTLPLQLFGMIVGNRHPDGIDSNTSLNTFFYPSRTLLVPAASILSVLQRILSPMSTMISEEELGGGRTRDDDGSGGRDVRRRITGPAGEQEIDGSEPSRGEAAVLAD